MSYDGFAFSAAPSPEQLAGFDLNDFGNAMRLIVMAGGVIGDDGEVDVSNSTLLYQLGLGWVGYNGRCWDRKLGEGLARKMAHRVASKLRGIVPAFEARGVNKRDAWKFIDATGNRGGTSSMLGQAETYLTVEIDAFDRDPMAINCRNGTLWLRHDAGQPDPFTIEKRPHSPADRISRLVDVDWDPEAAAPLFRQTVLDSLPAADVREFFKRSLGYSATGCTHEQAMFICQGLGRDGKSTILDAVRETLGGYGAVGNVATFLDEGQRGGGEAAPDIVKLSGDVRTVILSEPKRGAKLNEGLLKAWTGGAPITARELREKPFDFRPIGKLWMECNAFPVARGDDDGVWRRIYPILFERQVPVEAIDRLLPGKLRAEKAGILNWLLEGVGDWLGVGLQPPERVRKALDDYRKQSSPFGDWLTERCVWGQAAVGTRTLSKDLYDNYKTWAEDQGHDRPMSQRAFGDALHQRQILVAGKDGQGRKFRGPIRLKTAAELAADRSVDSALAAAAGFSEDAVVRQGAAGDDDWGSM